MLHNVDLIYTFLPAMLIGSTILIITNRRIKKQDSSELKKAIDRFKISSIVFGAISFILWMSLPLATILSTYGYPENIAVIKDNVKVLGLFQEYNKAIVRTTEVFFYFLFLFIFWFLTSLWTVAKAFNAGRN